MRRLLAWTLIVGATVVLDPVPMRAQGPAGAQPGAPRGAAGAISAGSNHTCVLVSGRVACWGANDQEQLGNTTSAASSASPLVVANSYLTPPPRQLASGADHTCALLEDSSVRCWGRNDFGQIDGEFASTTFDDPLLVTFPTGQVPVALTGGSRHTCALLADGNVTCWGRGADGELGTGPTPTRSRPGPTVALPGAARATAIDAGATTTCALLDTRQVVCWGSDGFGQLGNGAAGPSATPTSPVDLPAGRSATALTVGPGHVCAVLDDGTVSCWGNNGQGQLGNGTSGNATDAPGAPVSMPSGHAAVALAASDTRTCALLDDASLTCWGSGYATAPGASVLTSVRAVAAGSAHTCAVLTNGGVTCWGSDDVGQLGNGSDPANPNPGPLLTATLRPLGGRGTLGGGDGHTCVVAIGGGVFCAGWGFYGQTGQGTGAPSSHAFERVPLPQRATAVATGANHSCAVLADGRVTCWGMNSSAQLGTGAAGADAGSPITPFLPSGARATRLALGNAHSCALLTGGSVACWGQDSQGQVGDGGALSSAAAPVAVVLPGGRVAVDLAAGFDHTCALLDDGTVSCWGSDETGKLGNGPASTTVRAAPGPAVTIPDGPAVAIAAGRYHTCAALALGFSCWGFDASGQLGNGAGGAVDAPPPSTTYYADIAAIAAGTAHTCAIGPTTWACWGADGSGQLGNGATTGDQHTAGTHAGIATALGAGANHTCIANPNSNVTCWGADTFGQLGNGAQGSTTDASVGSPISGLLNVDSPAAPPAPPAAVTGSGSVNAATVSWSATPDDGGAPVQYYVLGGSVDGGAAWTLTESTAGGETTLGLPGLPPGSYVFRVAAVNAIGQGPWSPVSASVAVTDPLPGGGGSPLVTIDPVRLADTRPGPQFVTFDGASDGTTPVPAGGIVEIPVAGRSAIPSDAIGAVLNVTVTEPDAPGYLTVYPCTPDRPLASTVNHAAGQTVPNLAFAKLSPAGNVCVYSKAAAHVIVDATGYLPAGAPLTPVAPARLVDTRTGPQHITVDTFDPAGPVVAGTTIDVPITGRGTVPGGSAAALVNITVTEPETAGFLTAWPCGAPRPLASAVNFVAGQTVANAAFVKLSPSGTLCLYSKATAQLVVDVTGYLPEGTPLTPVMPARLLDTRPGIQQVTVDPHDPSGPVPDGTVIEVPVAGRGPVPSGATTALLNVTVTEPEQPGYVTAYPCTPTRPNASNVNYVPGQTVPNAVAAKLSAAGTICLYTRAATHLIVDVTGYQ